ncbi:hypothetical protein 2200_scaffold2278_00042 [Bacteriophage sp.]|nr:hypothetical protein 2200_scaffold2278_00042 [Bacteriophage sp.]
MSSAPARYSSRSCARSSGKFVPFWTYRSNSSRWYSRLATASRSSGSSSRSR